MKKFQLHRRSMIRGLGASLAAVILTVYVVLSYTMYLTACVWNEVKTLRHPWPSP